jgi:NAD+ kinase
MGEFMNHQVNTVGIVSKPGLNSAAVLIKQLIEWLEQRKMAVQLDGETAAIIRQKGNNLPRESILGCSDLLIVLGGDGTLLSIARILPQKNIPVLAVNFGRLGFLTETTLEDVFVTLEDFIGGRINTQLRMMIDIEVIREGVPVACFRALNDAVLTKGTLARIIDIDVRIDGHFVATYKADGLIVSTPTGSTAYTLSAGGPIVHPSLEAMLITPIASHTLTFRSLVIPDQAIVTMSFKPTRESIFLTVDGQEGLEMRMEDVVRVRKATTGLHLIPSNRMSFFDILRQKLKWGER